MKTLSVSLALLLSLGSASAFAANARQPYANIDKRVDQGNDTGNSQVEILNQQQLDNARAQNGGMQGGSSGSALGAPMAPAYPGTMR